MPDERPVLDPIEELLALRQMIEDMKQTLEMRVNRRPVGTIESTLRIDAPADALLCNGQRVNRQIYTALWQWANDMGLVGTDPNSLFGPGDGINNFNVPNFAGRFIMSAGTLGVDTYTLGQKAGAATKIISPANMAAHTHQVQIANHQTDVGSQTNGHVHGVHGHTVVGGVAFNPGSGTAPSNPTNSGTAGPDVGHQHYFFISDHVKSETVVGTNAPFDVRPPYIALNWIIWT